MKILIVGLMLILGICSVVASPKPSETNDSSKSKEGSGPGV